tara:strand:+ start:182 stop:1072 length:891 start_codon:yes stop_codon:yes gene_type:complete
MPPKKRTFNDYTSNPNAPTKKNAAKKRGWGKKGERTLSTPYTKEDFVKEWVIDQDDPVDVMLTMSGLGLMAKAHKAGKRLKKLNISEQTDKLQKRLKKLLDRKHKGKTLEGTAGSSPHGQPIPSNALIDPDHVLDYLQFKQSKEFTEKSIKKLNKQMDKQINDEFSKMTSDVERAVKREFPDISFEQWKKWEKEASRGTIGSKTPINKYGHGKGIGKAIDRALGGTHKEANRIARKLQKADKATDKAILKKRRAEKKALRKAGISIEDQVRLNKAGRTIPDSGIRQGEIRLRHRQN